VSRSDIKQPPWRLFFAEFQAREGFRYSPAPLLIPRHRARSLFFKVEIHLRAYVDADTEDRAAFESAG